MMHAIGRGVALENSHLMVARAKMANVMAVVNVHRNRMSKGGSLDDHSVPGLNWPASSAAAIAYSDNTEQVAKRTDYA